ncbi:hypothetical protein FF38_11042 [Lucilia cuprina]|uniref:Uncharacterized protein n=1 Tax=Lucilia cuprina TaxID=7375 RepID=A0A0L0BZN1_LUCCU|nr:hypothetical protein FF38_11042 [Lucilia cuprina]
MNGMENRYYIWFTKRNEHGVVEELTTECVSEQHVIDFVCGLFTSSFKKLTRIVMSNFYKLEMKVMKVVLIDDEMKLVDKEEYKRMVDINSLYPIDLNKNVNRIQRIINECKDIIKNDGNYEYTDTLTLIVKILKNYDSSKYVTGFDLKNTVDECLKIMYENKQDL